MGKGNTSCWAGDIVARNGKYYWYFSNHHINAGVMVADKPEGPYKDALGKPLVDSFDPTIFVDDDNTPYIIYGRTNYQIARLKDSMIELDEEPKTIVINKKILCINTMVFITYHVLDTMQLPKTCMALTKHKEM